MKTFKLPLLALGFLFAISAVFAFNSSDKKVAETVAVENAVEVSYHYKISSPVLDDMQDIENWEVADPECSTSGSLPCVIRYDGDINQFETYLQSFTNAADVTTAADEKKD